MELATTTPGPATPIGRDRALRREAHAGSPSVTDDLPVLTPRDPWTEALAQLALAAGRARQLALAADAEGWPEVMAAHAAHLARQRVRDLAEQLAEPDAAPGRVVCWAA